MTSKTGELRWSWLQTFGQLKYCFLVSSECEKKLMRMLKMIIMFNIHKNAHSLTVKQCRKHYRYQPVTTPEKVSQLIKSHEFTAEKTAKRLYFLILIKLPIKNSLIGVICFL